MSVNGERASTVTTWVYKESSLDTKSRIIIIIIIIDMYTNKQKL